MATYVVESYDYQVLHGGRMTDGAVGTGGSSEKIYLHLLELSDAEIAQLEPREDEHGNKQHDRLALPRNEEWWIAVEGEKVWPKTIRPKVVSRCDLATGAPVPKPVTDEEREALKKAGVEL
ncbi:MAG: hypothetical protein JRI23_25865 [Deltaproteobacteria bacterium]|jgi:hypothetical protein|nr:hypothetical protein [Deltaproteobacteria bacterium]MBW2535455.1 hypothetical protein [Deltaproteobacteria bacterium]